MVLTTYWKISHFQLLLKCSSISLNTTYTYITMDIFLLPTYLFLSTWVVSRSWQCLFKIEFGVIGTDAEKGISGWYSSLLLSFFEKCLYCFCKEVGPFDILTNREWSFLSLHITPALIVFVPFYVWQIHWCDVIHHKSRVSIWPTG